VSLLITAPRVIPASPGSVVLEPGFVAAEHGLITAVGQGPPPRQPDVALDRGVLVPGLVDLQVNGYYGVDFAAADPDGWAQVVRRLPETGTTAFLPTYITAPLPDLVAAVRSAKKFCSGLPPGARVLGLHLEGPFLSPARAGAHRREWIVPPTAGAVSELLDAGEGFVRLATLAPEAEGGLAAVATLAAAGVVVSVGHSDATASVVSAAAGAGATKVTHLFNAQRPMHHREPGVVGQALADRRLTSGLIVDFWHVAAEVCGIAMTAAPGRICLVTDAAACAGMPPGRYLLGGEEVELPPGDGVPPVRPDGTLAGSALRMDRALANAVSAGLSLPAAVAAATQIPADLIGRSDLGRIAEGAAADLTWLGDDLRTCGTWIAGEQVFTAG